MPEPDPFYANLQRGSMLLDQDRPLDALPFLQGAIAANPNAAQGYAGLARCLSEIPEQAPKSIDAINRAIALAPHNASYHGLKGWFLVCLKRHREAVEAARQGLALDPDCLQSLNALANGCTKLGRWAEAEAACRRMLALNPNNVTALNLLAQAQRLQGRWKESRETVAQILALTPDNSFGHTNAGYAALAVGDHLRANDHFLEALRQEPACASARRGLLHSLRARIWLIRLNIRLDASLRSLLPGVTPRVRYFLRIGLIFGGLALSHRVNAIFPHVGTLIFMSLIVPFIIYLYSSNIVYWITSFLLIFDPVGRHALTPREKFRAVLPVVLFPLLVALLIFLHLSVWAIAAMILVVVLFLTIQVPFLLDRWRETRERRLLES